MRFWEYYNKITRLLAPPAFPNTAHPILLKRLLRLLSPLSLARAPRASRVPQHRAPYITQAPATAAISPFPRASSSRLSRSPTPRTLYYSSACYGCYLPFPSRELLAPLAFPNTAHPILLKRLLRLLSPLSLARAPRASRVSQHRASKITQAPATQATANLSHLPQSSAKGKLRWPVRDIALQMDIVQTSKCSESRIFKNRLGKVFTITMSSTK